MQGQAVTWLVPHAVSQVLPPDVDYRVMLTFLEFYSTMLQARARPSAHSALVHLHEIIALQTIAKAAARPSTWEHPQSLHS